LPKSGSFAGDNDYPTGPTLRDKGPENNFLIPNSRFLHQTDLIGLWFARTWKKSPQARVHNHVAGLWAIWKNIRTYSFNSRMKIFRKYSVLPWFCSSIVPVE
jgi:hypothetical protein